MECLTHKTACQTFEDGCKIDGTSNMECPVNNCPAKKEVLIGHGTNTNKHVDDEHKLIKTERKRKGKERKGKKRKKGKKELTEEKTKETPSRKRFWG